MLYCRRPVAYSFTEPVGNSDANAVTDANAFGQPDPVTVAVVHAQRTRFR